MALRSGDLRSEDITNLNPKVVEPILAPFLIT